MSDTLVKVSGDLVAAPAFQAWVRNLPYQPPDIISGAGTAITKRLNEAHIAFTFGPSGRETTDAGRIIAHEELSRAASRVAGLGHPIPPVWPGTTLMLNGDLLALALYPNYNKVYIVTVEGREKTIPPGYDRLEVVFLPAEPSSTGRQRR